MPVWCRIAAWCILHRWAGSQAGGKANDGAAAVATALAAAVMRRRFAGECAGRCRCSNADGQKQGLAGNEIDLRLNYYPRDEQTQPASLFPSLQWPRRGYAGFVRRLGRAGDKQFDVMVMPFTDALA
ncbi:hypothetical protein J4530_12140 [Neisseria subflava]|uniref:hypothetical protein n=1 Tax=Neisseria subflava TaxID=28449 RepID=UPI00202A00A1|nr:hypothetical protein [Neisseria subflava]MCL9788836.1 hypothetical protein [Neisseria subflava]